MRQISHKRVFGSFSEVFNPYKENFTYVVVVFAAAAIGSDSAGTSHGSGLGSASQVALCFLLTPSPLPQKPYSDHHDMQAIAKDPYRNVRSALALWKLVSF